MNDPGRFGHLHTLLCALNHSDLVSESEIANEVAKTLKFSREIVTVVEGSEPAAHRIVHTRDARA